MHSFSQLHPTLLHGQTTYPTKAHRVTLGLAGHGIEIESLSAAGFALSLLVSNRAMAQDAVDVYGLGFTVEEMCDLRPNGDSRMTDKCYGFISAVAEIAKVSQRLPKERTLFRPACIPDGLKVQDIYKAIRPTLMDVGPCFGECTSTGFVVSALARVYPCKS